MTDPDSTPRPIPARQANWFYKAKHAFQEVVDFPPKGVRDLIKATVLSGPMITVISLSLAYNAWHFYHPKSAEHTAAKIWAAVDGTWDFVGAWKEELKPGKDETPPENAQPQSSGRLIPIVPMNKK